MTLTTDLRQEIEAELRRVRSPAKAARNLGIDIRDVLRIADAIGGISRTVRIMKYDGEGRPELRPYFVARKRAYQSWNNDVPEIAQARRDYEAGTHEMTTGRDGDFLILYSIPRRRPAPPRTGYFLPEI